MLVARPGKPLIDVVPGINGSVISAALPALVPALILKVAFNPQRWSPVAGIRITFLAPGWYSDCAGRGLAGRAAALAP